MLPNFLIAGQAKCGTSSLAYYLSQHPEIYISKRKEPRYFTSQPQLLPLGGPKDDAVEDWYVKSYEDYKALFNEVTTEKAIGEASADTMYFHKHTIPLIKEKLGDPKIIIILRNPVKRAFSAWQHLQRDAREHLPFREAVAAEPERIEKNFELIYHYTEVSKYADGIKAFQENFSQVKVILNEDLAKQPQKVLKEIYEFLGVDTEVEINTETQHNLSGIPKSRFLFNILNLKTGIHKIFRPITFFLSKDTKVRILNKLSKKNLNRLTMDPADSRWLYPNFIEDIEQTQQLIDKDLSKWRMN